MSAAEGTVACSCCRAAQPLTAVYEPVPRSGLWRCRDEAACRRRMAYLGDPVGVPGTAPPAAVSGTCSVCGATDPPGGVYQRTAGTHVCLDRPGCDERAVEYQYLRAHREDYPEVAVTTSAGMRHAIAGAGAGAVTSGRPLEPAAAEQARRDAVMQLTLARR